MVTTGLAYKPQKTIGRLFSKLKDPIPLELQSGVVYKLDCKDCDQCYIGHTQQLLEMSIQKHTRQSTGHHGEIKTGLCALTTPAISKGHILNFEEPKILRHEKILSKRQIWQMLFIKATRNTVNYRADIDGLTKRMTQ